MILAVFYEMSEYDFELHFIVNIYKNYKINWLYDHILLAREDCRIVRIFHPGGRVTYGFEFLHRFVVQND